MAETILDQRKVVHSHESRLKRIYVMSFKLVENDRKDLC